MINHIYGKVVFVTKTYLILESYGIGYKLNIKENNEIQVGENKRLFIHSIIKTNNKNCISTDYYAFLSPIERNLFSQLVTINGIGPIIANNIIDVGYKNIIQYIISEDVNSLSQVKGVNEKIARQIIINLVDQYTKIAESLEIEKNKVNDSEFIDALKQLGYSNQEINFALKTIDQNLELDERIGRSIKMIATNYGNS